MLPESRQRMASLKLILTFVLHFEAGVIGEYIYHYYRPGHDATLPCGSMAANTTCSIISWFYNRDLSTFTEVDRGKVQKSSARAARLSLGTNCSLIINNITAKDVGFYTCRQGDNPGLDQSVYLSVLTISPFTPDADPVRDGEVTLECSLMTYSGFNFCPRSSISWVDEAGTALLGEGDGYNFIGQKRCFSLLTVKRQSGRNRTYTCQFVDKGNKKVEADYTPVFTGGKKDQRGNSNSGSTDWPLSSIMLALRITGLILIIVITAFLIRDRMNSKPSDNDNNVQKDDDEVTYENVEAGPATVRLH